MGRLKTHYCEKTLVKYILHSMGSLKLTILLFLKEMGIAFILQKMSICIIHCGMVSYDSDYS